jgi:uncharacterized iron-regulated membrane protein
MRGAHAANRVVDEVRKPSRVPGLRGAWLAIHRWLGLTLGLVGALLGITGSLLVFDGEIDARLNPQRRVAGGSSVQRPMTEYIGAAVHVVDHGLRPVALQLPSNRGGVVTVVMRGSGGAAPSRVYLDPPTARVLDVSQGGGFVEWLHRLHGSLMLRDLWGRELVGVAGLAMLFSALSGIYLWWPGRAMAVQALRFRRRATMSRNLHHVAGFYISMVLAVIAFTGVYLAFPNAMREAVELFSPVTLALRGAPPPLPAVSSVRGKYGAADDSAIEASGAHAREGAAGFRATEADGARAADAPIGPDRAVEIALTQVPGAVIAGIRLPAGADGVYRVTIREARDPHTLRGGNALLLIDARSGEVRRRVDASTRTGGDTFLSWQAPLHTGEAFGLAGRAVVAIAGLAPSLLFVTGSVMWLRRPRCVRTSRG